MNKQQIKDAIVAHIAKHERCPAWRSIGVDHTNYELGVILGADIGDICMFLLVERWLCLKHLFH